MGGGGGSQTTTSTSGIPEEFRPYLHEVLGDVTERYKDEKAGDFKDVVAGLTDQQKEALELQEFAARNAAAGTGDYDNTAAVERALMNVQGQQLAGQANTGTLGSARGDRARQSALADQALQHQQARKQDITSGIQALKGAGDARQQQNQLEQDAGHTSAQRYFGYLGSTGNQSTQTSPKSGGK